MALTVVSGAFSAGKSHWNNTQYTAQSGESHDSALYHWCPESQGVFGDASPDLQKTWETLDMV